MFFRLSNEEFTKALDEVVTCCGVKEDFDSNDLVRLVQKKEIDKCVQEIATRLGLPIRIRLSYVPDHFIPYNVHKFYSTTVVKRDASGRAGGSITAQVSMPDYLPLFGSLDIYGYPIYVRVSENCHKQPHAFVATMAHELSHILLASLRSIHKDSELHTDLVPIILGFRSAVHVGRKVVQTRYDGNTTITETTTYGYLTDSQFRIAWDYVDKLLSSYSNEKKCLLESLEKVEKNIRKATQCLTNFRDYFNYLKNNPPNKMKKVHAERAVQLYRQDFSKKWEKRITALSKSIKVAEAFARPLNHYTNSAVEHLNAQTSIIKQVSVETRHIIKEITNDGRLLRRYVGLLYLLQKGISRLVAFLLSAIAKTKPKINKEIHLSNGQDDYKDVCIIQCDHCGQKLRVPRNDRLLKVKCPSCKNIFHFQKGEKVTESTEIIIKKWWQKNYYLLIGVAISCLLAILVILFSLSENKQKPPPPMASPSPASPQTVEKPLEEYPRDKNEAQEWMKLKALDARVKEMQAFKALESQGKEYPPQTASPIKPLVPVEPINPKRLPNGSSPLGPGIKSGHLTLTIDNTTDTDAVVRVVRFYNKENIRNSYILKGSKWKIKEMPPGQFILLVAFGEDWNNKSLKFNYRQSFMQTDTFNMTENDLIITLHADPYGNLHIYDSNEQDFMKNLPDSK